MGKIEEFLEPTLSEQNADHQPLNNFLGRFQEFEEELTTVLESDKPSGKKIKPKPGFCIKTKLIDGGKVFINICHSPDIPTPPFKSDAEVIGMLESNDATSYKVPMAIADPRDEQDKNGDACPVYDVTINDEFFAALGNNEHLKNFIINVIKDGIEDKYKCELNADIGIVLKNKKYFGKFMAERTIQDRPAPLISEIKSERNLKEPEYTLRKKPAIANSSSQHIVGEFKLDEITSMQDIILDLGEDRIVLKVADKYFLDIFLPYDIVQDNSSARFDKNTRVLHVDMPIVSEKN